MKNMILEHIYAFAVGAVFGRYLGIIPTLMAIGGMTYIVNPSIFTPDNINHGKELVMELIKNISK